MAKNSKLEKMLESGTDEYDTTSEEIGSSESDSEQEESQPKITKNPYAEPAPKKPNSSTSSKPHISSSEESESESDQQDPDSKTLASRPVDDPHDTATRNLKFKPSDSGPISLTKSAKRPAMEKGGDDKDSKRPKKKPKSNAENSEKKSNDDSKKQLFQRLWSEDDEIVVLNGLVDYFARKKTDPVADLNTFHDFIRKKLHIDVTKVQLQSKIRNLKKKYVNNRSKEKKGKERTFTKPHDQKAYDVSKKIWGDENGDDNEGEEVIAGSKSNDSAVPVRKTLSKWAMVETGDSKEAKLVENANGDVEMVVGKRVKFNDGNFEDWILRTGVDMIEEEKRIEMEREWEKLRKEETALYLRKLDLMYARTKQVLDVLKSS